VDWITRIPPDVFEKAMGNNIVLAEQHGARYGQLLRIGGMIDQKSSSMLTYLAILLAGVSILIVGGGETGVRRGMFGVLVAIEFFIVFVAAFLFLSCVRTISFTAFRGASPEAMLDRGMMMISGRFARFQVAYWLSVGASVLFAVLMFARLLAEYFL
jgi:hypothetical protein